MTIYGRQIECWYFRHQKSWLLVSSYFKNGNKIFVIVDFWFSFYVMFLNLLALIWTSLYFYLQGWTVDMNCAGRFEPLCTVQKHFNRALFSIARLNLSILFWTARPIFLQRIFIRGIKFLSWKIKRVFFRKFFIIAGRSSTLDNLHLKHLKPLYITP